MWKTLLKYSQFGFSTQYRNILQNCRTHPLQRNGGKFVNEFHCSAYMHSSDDPTTKNPTDHSIAPNIATKYERFTDDKVTIILDMEEEREKLRTGDSPDIEVINDGASNMFQGLNTERKFICANPTITIVFNPFWHFRWINRCIRY